MCIIAHPKEDNQSNESNGRKQVQINLIQENIPESIMKKT